MEKENRPHRPPKSRNLDFTSCFPNRTRSASETCHRCSGCTSNNPALPARVTELRLSPSSRASISIYPSFGNRHQTSASAPTPSSILFNSEENSDVVFLVGQRPNQWRFPGHSFILSTASPVFQNMISSSESSVQNRSETNINATANDSLKMIRNVEILDTAPDVFESILRFVYTSTMSLANVSHVLRLYQEAKRYQIIELVIMCLSFLLENINEENVLEIVSHLQSPRRRCPVIDEQCNNLQNEVTIRCFDVIDRCAESVLSSELFADLEHDILVLILKRDTLCVRSEMTVFEAATRWSCQECKRQQLELLPSNKRDCLGKALLYIRFLVMNPHEFQSGPGASGLLQDEEREAILSKLSGDGSIPLPDDMRGRRMDNRRPFPKGAGIEATSKRRPLGRSFSFSPSSDQTLPGQSRSHRPLCRKNSVDPKARSASKKVLKGIEDLFVCLIQLLD